MTRYAVKLNGQLRHQECDTHEQAIQALAQLAREWASGNIPGAKTGGAIFVDYDQGEGWERLSTHRLSDLVGLTA